MQPNANVTRQTVDLSSFPDLVVIYLGMKVRSPRGFLTLLRFGPRISSAVAENPPGLLLHESLLYSIFPLHAGMRQYWRDFDSLEAWARALPHQKWWQDFARDSGGTAFWHEAYFVRGGMEAVYIGLDAPLAFLASHPCKLRRAPCLARGSASGGKRKLNHKIRNGAK